jgi:hypothetical protein
MMRIANVRLWRPIGRAEGASTKQFLGRTFPRYLRQHRPLDLSLETPARKALTASDLQRALERDWLKFQGTGFVAR